MSLIWSGRILVVDIIAASIFIFQNTRSQFFVIRHFRVFRQIEMNRCLICAIVLLLSPRSKGTLMLLLIIITSTSFFCSTGGAFLVLFSIRNTGLKTPFFHLCLLD
jgi:hypothetical protein